MADTKTTGLGELTAYAANDLFMVVDVSDTSMAATGTNKKITATNVLTAPPSALDLGAQATPFRSLYVYGSGTYGSHSLRITGTPTGHRIITLPDGTLTLASLTGTETLTNKTLTTPTIGSFANAAHNHQDAAGGAQLALAAFSSTTGTGAVVGASSPTITTPTISGAITFPDNVRQTFNPGANAAGLNVGAIAGDPDTPSNGDLWYDSTANELTARINGANVALGAGGGSQTPWTANVDADGFSLLVDDGTGIFSSEASNPELLKFTSVASAVNELTITNAATGSNPILSATGGDTDIGITLTPKGTGNLVLNIATGGQIAVPINGSAATPSIYLQNSQYGFFQNNGVIQFTNGGTAYFGVSNNGQVRARSDALIGFSSGATIQTDSLDAYFSRSAASIIGVTSLFEFTEVADPSAPASNKARLYVRDNGSGKTQLVVVFPTGAVQVVATEP